jgi:hypothetical protein
VKLSRINEALIVVMADGPKNTGPDFGKASPVGLLIVVLLLIAVCALVWSMNRHLRKARAHFAAEEAAPASATPAGGESASPVTREPSGESGG